MVKKHHIYLIGLPKIATMCYSKHTMIPQHAEPESYIQALPKTRTIIDGNIINLGNKNLVVHLTMKNKFIFKDIRGGKEFILKQKNKLDSTGIYELVDKDTKLSLRNNKAVVVEVIVLGDLLEDITEVK